jgi:selenocysteine lyase/cysteine desulfurase
MSVNRRQFVLSSGLGAAAAALGRGTLAAVPAAATPARSEVRSKEIKAAHGLVPLFRPDDWGSVRAQFRLAAEYAHLSNFFIVSHPAPVRDAIDRYRKALDENPFEYLEKHMFEDENEQLWRRVTAAAAEYVGGKPEEIALTGSTTMGLALVYNGLRLRPGQEILATTHDHYSHHESIRLAADKWGALTRRIPLYDTGP